ncbi:SDR family NAD(P)-dependent oxidoreductase [Brevibacterium marinum]|uniref:3-oxoacyl-[acyl-carrier protein] reductase n=1 Tax=Brevibacterium marinum TaxID=418643 RepID=A0A846RSQ0_9MICO|nr:SDR family oxidoreductase [Brevibacterium marinum]NJC55006.1 3-oxoacyl-[acyl-carrier protein] reductase [Brevibacterium marinum]
MSDQEPIVVVTGGGSGMGRDIALSQVAAGRRVAVIGRREDALEETIELSDARSRMQAVSGDLSTVEGAESVVARLGGAPVIGLVTAAGGQGDFFRTDERSLAQVASDWSEAIAKNFTSALLIAEALADRYIEHRSRVVLIGSTAGIDGAGGPYSVAKAAVHAYARDLARRLGPRGITANAIVPGFVADTEFFEAGGFGSSDPMVDRAAQSTLVGRVGRPRDITAAADWLLSEDAGWVTGQSIVVDGGTQLAR